MLAFSDVVGIDGGGGGWNDLKRASVRLTISCTISRTLFLSKPIKAATLTLFMISICYKLKKTQAQLVKYILCHV